MNYIWRNLMQRKVRTGLSVLGVAASVAGIVALISVARGMRTSLNSYMEQTGASLVVFSRDAADLAFSRVKAEDAAAMAEIDGVDAISRANAAVLMGPDLGDVGGDLRLAFCFGRYPGERAVTKYRELLVDGDLPTEKHHLLVGQALTEETGLRVGSRFPLFRSPKGGVEEFEVVGVYEANIAWENGALIAHADVLQDYLAQDGSYNVVFLYSALDATDRVRAAVEARFPNYVAQPPDDFTDRFADQLAIVDEFILLVTMIAVIVGVLGVLNTMMMSVAERTREIGMLRALGWPKSLVVRVILAEGLLLSVLGGVTGMVLGVAGTELLVAFFQKGLLEAEYLVSTFLYGLAVAFGVGVLAALYPAWRAANLRPVEALRYE